MLEEPDISKKLHQERSRLEKFKKFGNQDQQNALAEPFRSGRFQLRLSLSEFPTQEQLVQFDSRRKKQSWFKQWYSFIGGEWLEEWVAQQIRSLQLSPQLEVRVGVQTFRGEERTQLEIDVVVVRGYRSYFLSCTTSGEKSLCKSKLFEVATRARQLGGDLARAALVCLAKSDTASALQKDIEDMWGASNTPQVFGLEDVRCWSDCGDKQPNLSRLKEWLES